MITKAEYEAFSPEKKAEIERKCRESPAYFYNNFWRSEGKPELTDEQFARMKSFAENPLFFKGRNGFNRQATYASEIQKGLSKIVPEELRK